MISRRSTLLVLAFAVACPASAQAQRLGGAAAPEVSIFRTFLALIVCLVIAALAIFLVRQRYSGRTSTLLFKVRPRTGRTHVAETRRIAPQADLCLVECDEQEYLLLITSGGPLLLRQQQIVREGRNRSAQ